jgi:hypothetical protein
VFDFDYKRLMEISAFRCILKAMLVFALMLSFFSMEILPALAEEEPQLEWETIFGWQGYRSRVVTASQSDDGGYMVVVEKRLDVDWRSDTYVTVSACVVKIDAGGQKVWEKVLVKDCDGVGDALQTADGGLIIGLSTKLPVSLTDQLLRNITAIKIDASGGIVWDRTFGGEKDDYVTCMEETDDGGCFVAGSSNSFNTEGGYDVYLVKLNASGEKIWVKTYGGNDNDAAQVVLESGDGGCFIAGSTCTDIGGNDHIYLVKIDANGNIVRENNLGTWWGPDSIRTAQRTTDGGLVMVGATGSFPGWENINLIKVDAAGEKSWEKVFGRDGDFHDYGISLRETKEGGFIVLGDTSPFGEGRSVLLIKTDTFGDKVWESIFQDKDYVWSSGVEQSGDGYIITGGEHDQESSDTYVIKTDSEGGTLWKKTLDKSIIEPSSVLLPTRDGGCLIAGINGWDGTNHTKYNIYIAKLGPDQTNREETGSQPVKVYLNGNQLFFDVPPIIEDGRTLAPLRAIGEALGAKVAWEGQTQAITLDMAATKIELKIGDPVAYVNGEAVILDVPSKIMAGRTLVPLRFIGEHFGAVVQWDGVKRVIIIEIKP